MLQKIQRFQIIASNVFNTLARRQSSSYKQFFFRLDHYALQRPAFYANRISMKIKMGANQPEKRDLGVDTIAIVKR